MRRKARMRLIIILVTITLGTLALAQANQETASVARIQQSPPTGTYFDHLVFIMMENAGMSNICGSGNNPPPCNGPDNPYMSGLANSYGLATQYVDLIGTSQPNYIGIMAATLNGCTSSCGPGTLTETNLVDRFDTAGLGWKAYMEDQTPVAGCDNNDHGFYQIAHNPFVAFQDIDTNSTRCNRIVLANPANNSTCTGTDCALVKDLNSGSAPNFMWVTPNDCNNAHGLTGCANGCVSSYTSPCEKAGDNYLSSLVPNILNSNTFKNTRAALFITFDEGSGFCPLNGSGEDCMYTVWAGPTTQTNMFSSNTLRDHYAFTKTIETNWSLATMTSNDAAATAMTEFFKTQSPDFAITASPSSLAFPFGSSANSNITLSSLGSFAGTVTLTKTSTPTGLTLTLNPTSVMLTSGGIATSTLTVSSSTIGNYTASVTGTSGTHIHNATVTIRVTPQPNFALSVNPTSLTLTHAVSGVASPVTIHSTGDRTVFESSYLANSFYAKGLIWLFYEDSSNTCEHQAGCLTYTTSTNGSSWASPTTVPVHITDSDFSVTTNGTSIFYARYNESSYIADCGRKLQLGIGNLGNSGSVTWQPEKTITAGASNRVYADDEILLDSNGQIWIAYLMDNHGACGGNSTDLPLVIHSAGTNYNSWTGNTTLTTAHSGNWHIALVSLGGGQVYAAYWIAAIDVHGQLYNNGWKGDEQISSTTTSSDVNSWLFNSGSNVYIIYFDDSTQSFNFATRSSAGTWAINTIGIGESHTGSKAFPGYYSLPDAASYDLANNQFHLFYMNFTTQKIDEWTGAGNSWNKTTGVVSTTAVPYADSITSFIQSSPIEVGGIFYISGSSSPFNVNFAALTFASTSLAGSFTVTVTSQNGFAGTVTLSTVTTPSTGLTVTCTVTTITGGSGSSTCNLSSTTAGSYNVNVTGVSGSLSHSATVAVTVPAGPDFSITATTPGPTNVGQSQTSTITVTALNGFIGVIGLSTNSTSCSVSPASLNGSGSSTLSCTFTSASIVHVGVTGTSGSLSHSVTVTYIVQDFTIAASPTSVTTNVNAAGASTITLAGQNGFAAVVALATNTTASCGVSPTSITGSGSSTLSCTFTTTGTKHVSVTGTSSALSHSVTVTFAVQDFTISATSPPTVNAGQSQISTVTVSAVNGFAGTVTFSRSASTGLSCGPFTPASVAGSGSAMVSCSATVAGNYTATITGTSTLLVHNATVVFQFGDFTITIAAIAPVNVGGAENSTITVAAVNHFAGQVSLTNTLPSGLTCATINPTSVTGSGVATISCSSNTAGNYTLTITGTSTVLSHNATIIVAFRDYSITANLATVKINAGSNGSSTITIAPLNHFSGTVSLSSNGTTGLTSSIIPTSVPGGSGVAALTFSASLAGNYTLTVTSSSGTLTHTTTVNVQVVDFTIVANPSTMTILAGATVNSTVTVTASNGFTGTVNLALRPSMGLTTTITPSSLPGSGTSTLRASLASSGDYSVTINATSGSLVHTILVTIHVLDYSLAGSPVSMTAPIGSTTGSTLTLQSLNGYSGNVSLTYTIQVVAVISPGGGVGGGAHTLTMAPPTVLPTVSISPQTLQFLQGSMQQSTVSIALPSNLLAGSYLITVIALGGTLSHQIVIALSATDFSITASPSSVSIRPGSNTTVALSLRSLNLFQGNVTLTVNSPSGGPNGILTTSVVRLAFNSNSNLNLTIQVPGITALGNYTITVQATSGTISHPISILVSVSSTGFVTVLAEIFSAHNAIPISALAILTLLTSLVTLKVRTYAGMEQIIRSGRRVQNRNFRRFESPRYAPSSSSLPVYLESCRYGRS